jgi:signal transduction histidine kinase
LSGEDLDVLAEEQAALRRVATLVARGAAPEEVFAAVTEEIGRLLPVDGAGMGRYEPDGTLTFVASWGRAVGYVPVGSRWSVGGKNIGTLVFETGRPARIDSYADASGPVAVNAREKGVRSSVATPIIVEGRLWGVVGAGSSEEQPLPGETEERLASFTELLATAIANAESRAALARLAEEQAALRRVATLVARGAAPEEVFAAVTEEFARLGPVDAAAMARFEPDGTFIYVASWGRAVDFAPVGSRWTLDGNNVATAVFETGRPTRVESQTGATGSLADLVRDIGVRSLVATPVVVAGRLWGELGAGSTREEPLPLDAEARLASFTELVATAIANADSRAMLMASRARIVAAADETRRRIERDLHDGTQQRLVSLGLAARTAAADVAAGRGDPGAELSRIAAGLADAAAELQEVSRGIHPAVLSERGLGPALRTLARRSAVPVDLDLAAEGRYPEPVEVAAYYVASEALANAMKHARASRLEMSLATRQGSLLLSVRDDGIGGADPASGSGLAGLTDRVEALGGSIHLESAAEAGTHIAVDLPLEYELAQGAG